jgi:fatty acid-binding protein DegV
MASIAIVTDSSALLPSDSIVAHDIHVVPLTVLWGSDTYLDGVEITPLEFYQRLKNWQESTRASSHHCSPPN